MFVKHRTEGPLPRRGRGRGTCKKMLTYKSHSAGIFYAEVPEYFTTQMCSCCLRITGSSPKGRAGLGIREWRCSACGAVHDRDVNAAKNILARGLARLAEGTPPEERGVVKRIDFSRLSPKAARAEPVEPCWKNNPMQHQE